MMKDKAKRFWNSYQYAFYLLLLIFIYRLAFCYTIFRVPFSQDNVMGKYYTSSIPNPIKMNSLEQRLAIFFNGRDTLINAGNNPLVIRKGYFEILDAYNEDGKVLTFIAVEPIHDEPFSRVLLICNEDLEHLETHF